MKTHGILLKRIEFTWKRIDFIMKLEILKSDEKSRKNKVLRMGGSGGQNDRTPRGSILVLSRGSQLPYTKKITKF